MKQPQLLVFENSDKQNTTSKFDPTNLANLPSPFCALLCASPSSGKSSLIMNLVLHQKPKFKRILLYHFDENTSEYDNLDVEIINEPPTIEDFNRDEKTLLVIEDINFSGMNKIERAKIDRCFGYISTHYNCSIVLTSQVYINVPVSLRRMATHLFMWKNTDRRVCWLLSACFGIDKRALEVYFGKLTTRFDFLCITNAVGAPRITKNVFEIVSAD